MAERAPAALRRAVAETCAPVRPLAAPARRATALAPWAMLLAVVVLAVWGLRGDYSDVGVWRLWGASAVQLVLAIAIASAAIAESVPGRFRSVAAHLTLAGAAVAVVAATTLLTFAASGTAVPAAFCGALFLDLPHAPVAARVAGPGGTRDDGGARADREASRGRRPGRARRGTGQRRELAALLSCVGPRPRSGRSRGRHRGAERYRRRGWLEATGSAYFRPRVNGSMSWAVYPSGTGSPAMPYSAGHSSPGMW